MGISLCMIAQDEEARVGRTINSVYDIVDEVVVVDGGSLDATVAIVRAYDKATVYEIPFLEKNFGVQKNNALERATCEWLFLLDADEFINRSVAKCLERLTKLDYDAFGFSRHTVVDGYLINLIDHDYQIRLFRNYVRYSGALHESPTGFTDLGLVNLSIEHDKTSAEQQKDNELYWDMGQAPPPGWLKQDGVWTYIMPEAPDG